MRVSFSILKRIVMGETYHQKILVAVQVAFSILKRIVMGETEKTVLEIAAHYDFQYPQADRDG